jgi:hypothetical protein
MTVFQKPVFMTSIECPVCHNINEFENLKVGAYTESGRDSDFCPTGRTWTDPSYQKFNPLLFYFTTCHKCYYSRELNSSYKEWNNDTNFKSYKLPIIRKKHLEEISKENSLVKLLGDNINVSVYPFESAVLKILLTIYDEILSEKASHLDLARYFLRLAWLFREQSGGKLQSPVELAVSRLQCEIDRIQNCANEALHKIEAIKEISDKIVANDDMRIENFDCMNDLLQTVLKVENTSSNFRGEIDLLRQTAEKTKNNLYQQSQGNSITPTFGDQPSFSQFLSSVKKIWDEIPTNENESLKKSIEYYIRAYQKGREIGSGLPQLQAAYLIGELSRRIGDYSLAQEYFRITVKEGHRMVVNYKNDQAASSNIKKMLEMAIEQTRSLGREIESHEQI